MGEEERSDEHSEADGQSDTAERTDSEERAGAEEQPQPDSDSDGDSDTDDDSDTDGTSDSGEDAESENRPDPDEFSESIGTEDARELLGTNQATAIDLRDAEEWRTGHLPGARRISADEISDVDDLPDHKLIVVSEDGKEGAEVAEKLRDDGHDAVVLEGGMNEWRSDDLPMQPSRDPDEDSPI